MPTYKPLQSIVLTSSTTSVTFSGIDQNYADLVFVSSFLKPTGGSPRFRFNSDTSALYSQTVLYGNGTSALSGRETGQTAYYLMDFFNPSTTNPNHATIYLHNYSKTNTFKTILERSGAGDIGTEASIGVYRSNNAITSITISADGGSGVFSAGTTFDLYGIQSGSPKASGGQLLTDGNYWYHIFTETQTFTPSQSISCQVTSTGGGGGGGWNNGGGGGGAELKINSSLSVTAQTYTVTIGSGGSGSTGVGSRGGTGTSSTITIGGTTYLTALGGGGGGTGDGNMTGATGGSGGGGSLNSNTGGTPSGDNTFAGGSGSSTANNYSGGGGGGATAAGVSGTISPSKGGNGGEGYSTANMSGISSLYSPAQVWSSGGGGGNYSGTRGFGGTGAGNGGQGTTVAAVGTTYGSGGGGGGYPDPYRNGAAGARGIMIIRYPV